MTELRDRVAVELGRALRADSLDNPWSDTAGASTRTIYAPDGFLYEASRLRFHESVLEEHRALTPSPVTDGSLAVVVTAGPPGSGKSTALERMPELCGYRSIDADEFKDPLLLRAQADGLVDRWTARRLADDRPVQLREIAGFVHAESTTVADTLRRRALRNGENVVVHGTLSSVDYLDDLLAELDDAGYEKLRIVTVEVPLETAIAQATDRWWSVRDAATDPLGGRFVPEAAIRRYYPTGSTESVCGANARVLGDRAADLGWDVSIV
ncbi:dephospho-CoA kinase [Curtobacterium sp. PhB142]|uniref:zeta toxin family protein n=1 Tax=unclassified Curtobacterium TaxID=257496 RepID=UPI000F496CFE|nr:MULTISPECIES: zeta toxin family protein [unclassified Curtobacterium]QSB23170.1 zeta toxin family protein [Curtobacterium sp. 24E2]MBF4602983.1 zeta toxin family protein [Curtobacterium sp. VKM Ac-2884]ROQ04645.1 dephospho-CoA kinase [Curtobacterium sp. PhB171]ROQ28405.1 dephospho-CoA kinase [Curtobacterium sp. PhB170]ROS33062.1 dephospho-CoA kinase [Curtobacterium sp. PhB131]